VEIKHPDDTTASLAVMDVEAFSREAFAGDLHKISNNPTLNIFKHKLATVKFHEKTNIKSNQSKESETWVILV
jgi:hypothetical protein